MLELAWMYRLQESIFQIIFVSSDDVITSSKESIYILKKKKSRLAVFEFSQIFYLTRIMTSEKKKENHLISNEKFHFSIMDQGSFE